MADSGTEQTAVATPEKITMKKKDKSRRSKTDKGNLAVEISKQREFEEQVKTQDSQVGIVAETSLLYCTVHTTSQVGKHATFGPHLLANEKPESCE